MEQINDYLNSPEVLALAESSQKSYGYSMKHLENFRIAYNIPGYEHFQEIMSELAKYLERQGLSGNSIQQNLTHIKIFLKWTGHPVEYTYKIDSTERKRHKVKHMKRWFSENDVAKCLAYRFPNQHTMYHVLIHLAMDTGARAKELANLKAEDIDLDDMTAKIEDSKTAPRYVAFSPDTRKHLGKLQQHVPWEGRIFPNESVIEKVISRMLKKLGLKNGADGRGIHTFRSWTCTKLLYSGVRIEDIALYAGDTVGTIRARYIHPSPLMLREEIRKGMKWDY